VAAVRSVTLTVPESPTWIVQVRWMETDGAAVKKGQRLIEFDSSSVTATLEDRRLAVEEAEAELARSDAEASVVLEEKLFAVEQKKALAARARIDASVPEELQSRREHQDRALALQKAETELAKAGEDLAAFRRAADAERSVKVVARDRTVAERDEAEGALAGMTLAAAQDGFFVVSDNPRERRKFQVGDSAWPGLIVARIPDLSSLQAEAWLFDVDDGKLAEGAAAVVVPDAFPSVRLAGRVEEISAVAQSTGGDSPRRAFKVVVPVRGEGSAGLRPGMSVKVETGPAPAGAVPPGAGLPAARAGASPGAEAAASGERVRVAREDLVLGVEMKGALAALDSEALGPVPVPRMWEYRISMMAPEGGTVKKGEPVLGFDTTALARELETTKADGDEARELRARRERELQLRAEALVLARAEAEARHGKAGLKADVPEALQAQNVLQQARIDRDLAAAEVESVGKRIEAAALAATLELGNLARRQTRARSRVAEISRSIEAMTVRAPRDGTVLYLTNWRDEKKKVGDAAWRAEKVMEVPDLSRLGVKAEVDEADAGRVAVGQRAAFRLDAQPDLELDGKVIDVRRTVQRSSPRTPQKVAKLDVLPTKVDPKSMRPGMRVRGRVELERLRRVLSVPLDCVAPSASGPLVWRAGAGGLSAVAVTTGRRNEERVEVLSGLKEGDLVVRLGGAGRRGGE
jgi:multidrug resistance efflux pump